MNEFVNDPAFYTRVYGNMYHKSTFNRDRAILTLWFVLENPRLLCMFDRRLFGRTTIKHAKLRWLCGKDTRKREKSPLLKWLFFKLVCAAVAHCLDVESTGRPYTWALRGIR